MTRKDFLINSCSLCLSTAVIAALLPSCTASRYVAGRIGKDGLMIDKEEFKIQQKGNTAYRSFIIVRNDALKYPICLYRHSEDEYSALWMQCTHQGAELQASGDVLQCPAHGSEFNNKGKVTSGPAASDLRSFPVTVNQTELFIDLRKQS